MTSLKWAGCGCRWAAPSWPFEGAAEGTGPGTGPGSGALPSLGLGFLVSPEESGWFLSGAVLSPGRHLAGAGPQPLGHCTFAGSSQVKCQGVAGEEGGLRAQADPTAVSSVTPSSPGVGSRPCIPLCLLDARL